MLLNLLSAVIFSVILFVLVALYLFYSFTVRLLGLQKGEEIKTCVQPTLCNYKVFPNVFEESKELYWKMDGQHGPGKPIFHKSLNYTNLGRHYICKSQELFLRKCEHSETQYTSG